MNFLLPQVLPLPLGVKAAVPVPVTVRLQVRVTRVRTLAPAVAYVPDSKAVSSLCTESFLREALRTDSLRNTLV